MAGTVEEVGEGVTAFASGDEVYGMVAGVGGFRERSPNWFSPIPNYWHENQQIFPCAKLPLCRSRQLPLGKDWSIGRTYVPVNPWPRKRQSDERGKLASWSAEIERNRMPAFGGNLFY